MAGNQNIRFYAKFNKNHRTNTQIRINGGKKFLGSIIMLNPGSSKSLNIKDADGYELCDPDDTMQEIEIILNDYSKDNKGEIRIINLSDVIQQVSKEFFKSPQFKQAEDIENEFRNSPWIWIAWTCNKDSKLMELQEDIMSIVRKNSYITFGEKGKTKNGYYHPLGIKLNKNRLKIEDYIKQKLKEHTS